VFGNSFKGDREMIFRNNVFVGGNYYCSGAYKGKYKSNIWQGNKCYIRRGDYILSNYSGTADEIRIPEERGAYKTLKTATDAAVSKYREMTGDMTIQFVIEKERSWIKK
jgi:hypothetical protein